MKTAVGLASKKVTTDSGLVYEDMVVGDGRAPQAKDFMAVHYTCKLAKTGKSWMHPVVPPALSTNGPNPFRENPFNFNSAKVKSSKEWKKVWPPT